MQGWRRQRPAHHTFPRWLVRPRTWISWQLHSLPVLHLLPLLQPGLLPRMLPLLLWRVPRAAKGLLRRWRRRESKAVGEGRDDAGAQLVGLGMGQFQRRHLLQMVVQQPGMIDQGLQNQRLAARDRAALAAHQRAQCKLRARRLIGTAVDGLAAGRGLGTATAFESARGAWGERTAARRKTPA